MRYSQLKQLIKGFARRLKLKLAGTATSSKPLAFIIGGFEHSGTTLVSEILRQHPMLDSAFEGGLLLPRELSEFPRMEPFAKNFKNGWKVSEGQLEEICKAPNVSKAYSLLRTHSGILKSRSVMLFDKTPRYMAKLPEILFRVKDVKAVVMVRDMRSIIDSTFSRSKMGLNEWIEGVYPITRRHTLSYLDGLSVALSDPSTAQRVMVVRYEDLVLSQRAKAKEIFDFLGYQFDEQYLSFEGVRYKNVYGSSVSNSFITKYRENLTPEFIEQIKSDFAGYAEYFWDE